MKVLEKYKIYFEDIKTEHKYGLSKEYFHKLRVDKRGSSRQFYPFRSAIQFCRNFYQAILSIWNDILKYTN